MAKFSESLLLRRLILTAFMATIWLFIFEVPMNRSKSSNLSIQRQMLPDQFASQQHNLAIHEPFTIDDGK